MGKFFYKVRPLIPAALGAALSYYAVVPAAGAFLFGALVIMFCAAACALHSAVFFARGKVVRLLRYAALLGASLVSGFFLGGAARFAQKESALLALGQSRESVNMVSGTLLDDPRLSRNGRGMGTLRLSSVRGTGVAGTDRPVTTSASGNILVLFPDETIPRIKEFGRGSAITVDGSFAAGNSAADNGTGALFFAKSAFVVKPPSPLDQARTSFRIACVNLFSPHRWGGLALALLIGIRDNLDNELAAQYQNAGISYILALSGMHLAIISAVLAFLLKKPLGLKAASISSAALIVIYVYAAGAQASLVRSGLMYVIGTIAVVRGWKRDTLSILCLSFLLQLAANPESGAGLSFILSYSALAGLLLLSGIFADLMRGYVPQALGSALSASSAAFTATLAITAGFFGALRPVGILCGLVMVPLSTVFMIGALVFPLIHLIPFIGKFLAFVLSLLYALMEKIVYLCGALPPLKLSAVPALLINIALIVALIAAHRYVVQHRFFFKPVKLTGRENN